jgi:hypothetical protein
VTEPNQSPLRELCRGVWPVQDAESEALRRERIGARVLELGRELSARTERRRRQGRWLALAAIVSCACGVLWLWRATLTPVALGPSDGAGVRLVGGHANLSHGGALDVVEQGRLEVSENSFLVTQVGESAELRLASETAVHMGPASEVGLERERTAARGFEERVRLRAGSVALRVPKLGTRGRVSVQTGDALVEVHGTQFSVAWIEPPALPPFTEVDVREGRVLVRSNDGVSRFLGAGEHWRSNEAGAAPPITAAPAPESIPAPSPVPSAPPAPPPAPSKASARSRRAHTTIAPAPTPSELAAQNRLLEAAELAQKSGLSALALQRLETLIARYPESELAHNARVQRLRLLLAMHRDQEAAAAARDYLDRHPRGFAHEEAEHALLPSKPGGR